MFNEQRPLWNERKTAPTHDEARAREQGPSSMAPSLRRVQCRDRGPQQVVEHHPVIQPQLVGIRASMAQGAQGRPALCAVGRASGEPRVMNRRSAGPARDLNTTKTTCAAEQCGNWQSEAWRRSIEIDCHETSDDTIIILLSKQCSINDNLIDEGIECDLDLLKLAHARKWRGLSDRLRCPCPTPRCRCHRLRGPTRRCGAPPQKQQNKSPRFDCKSNTVARLPSPRPARPPEVLTRIGMVPTGFCSALPRGSRKVGTSIPWHRCSSLSRRQGGRGRAGGGKGEGEGGRLKAMSVPRYASNPSPCCPLVAARHHRPCWTYSTSSTSSPAAALRSTSSTSSPAAALRPD